MMDLNTLHELYVPPLSIRNYYPDAWFNWFNKFKSITKATIFSTLSDSERVSVLLLKLGSEINPIFDEFGLDVDTISYDDLVRRFQVYFQPLKARNILINLKQKSGESFEQFAERLTVHSYPCLFGPGTLRDNYLIDIFLNNIEDKYCNVRTKILESYSNLQFREVVDLADKLFLEECGFNGSGASNGVAYFPGTHQDSKIYNQDSQVFRGAGQGNHCSQNQGAYKAPRSSPVPSFPLNPIYRDDTVTVQILSNHTDITYVSPVSYEETRNAFFKFFNEKQRKTPIKVEVGKRYAAQFEGKWYRVDVASIQINYDTASVQSVDFGWRKHFPLSELYNLILDCICLNPMALMVTFVGANRKLKEGEKVTLKFLNEKNGLWTVRLMENGHDKKYNQNQDRGNKNKLDELKPKRDELNSDSLESQSGNDTGSTTVSDHDSKRNGSQHYKREQISGNRNNLVPDKPKPKMREQIDRGGQKSKINVDQVNNVISTGRMGNRNQSEYHEQQGQNYQADNDNRDNFNRSVRNSSSRRTNGGNKGERNGSERVGGFNRRSGDGRPNRGDYKVPDSDHKDDGSSQRTNGGSRGEHSVKEKATGFNRHSGGGRDYSRDYKLTDSNNQDDGRSQRTNGGNRGDQNGSVKGSGYNKSHSGDERDHGNGCKDEGSSRCANEGNKGERNSSERVGGFNRHSGGGRPNGGDYNVPDSDHKDDVSSRRTSGGSRGENSGMKKASGFNRHSGGGRDYELPDGKNQDDGRSQRTNGGNRDHNGSKKGGGFNKSNSGVGGDHGGDWKDDGSFQHTSGGSRGMHNGNKRGSGFNNYRLESGGHDGVIPQTAVGNNPIPLITDLHIDDPLIPIDRFTKVVFLNLVGQVAYVYPESCQKEFEYMMGHLRNISENPSICPVLRFPKKGLLCAAPYEDSFYRAEILEIQAKSVKVLFIDFGNEEIVPREDLRELPEELSGSRLAFRVKDLESSMLSDLLVSDVIEVRLKYMDEGGVCVVDVRGCNGAPAGQDHSGVDAGSCSTYTSRSPSYVDDPSRGDKLKSPDQPRTNTQVVRSRSIRSAKTAQPVDDRPVRPPKTPIPKNMFSEVRVAHVGVEGCFVFPMSSREMLREIHLAINSESLSTCSSPKINKLCAAPFEGEIYRAKILSINRSLCRVEFIDFGNHSDVPTEDLLELPDHLTNGVYIFKIRMDCDKVLELNDTFRISPVTLEADGTWLVQLEGEPLTADYQLPSVSSESTDERDDFIEFSNNTRRSK